MNILFLGNSLMFFNDMPDIFFGLTMAGGKTVHVASVTKGAATMSDFADESTEVGKRMREQLNTRAWDVIVIEPSRRITPFDDTVLQAEIASAQKLQAIAATVGAKIILYAVWGNNTGNCKVFTAHTPTHITAGEPRPITRRAHARFMHETAHRVSDALGGVTIVEAGYAFENLLADAPDRNLYHEDLRHPSPDGSYLAACAFYAKIFGEKTEGLCDGFACSDKASLQKVADETVLGGRIPDLNE